MPGGQNPAFSQESMGFPGQDRNTEYTDTNASQVINQWLSLLISIVILAAGLVFALKFRK